MMGVPKNPITVKNLYYAVIAGPWDKMGLAASNAGLLNIQSSVTSEKGYLDFLKRTFDVPPQKDEKRLKPMMDQLLQYLKGERQSFDIPLDLISGTDFQQQVWRTLAAIPYGETRSYAWLARAVGRPKAFRAVGNANGKNPLPILLPCHRVIQENGDLGGYSGGLHIKRALLDLERTGHAAL